MQNVIGKRVLALLSDRTSTSIGADYVSFARFKKLEIQGLYIEDQNQDTLVYASNAIAIVDTFNVKTRYLSIKELSLSQPVINVSRDVDSAFNFQFIIDSLVNEDTPDSLRWTVNVGQVFIDDGHAEVYLGDEDNQFFVFEQLNLAVEKYAEMSELKALSFVMDNGFELQDLNLQLIHSSEAIEIPHLSLQTPNSKLELNDISAASLTGVLAGVPLDSILVYMHSSKSRIGGKDVSYFLPKERHLHNDVVIDGAVGGSLSAMELDDFHLSVDNTVDFIVNAQLNDLLDNDKRAVDINLEQVSVDVVRMAHLLSFYVPDTVLDLSPYFHWEEVSYSGRITGNGPELEVAGALDTKYGRVKTDGAITFTHELETFVYNVGFSTSKFQLGDALERKDIIGDVSVDIALYGDYEPVKQFDNHFIGDIYDLSVLDYSYSHVFFKGDVTRESFLGVLEINDPNIKLEFDGKVDLSNDELHDFDYYLKVDRINLSQLNIIHSYDSLNCSLEASAKLCGTSIDNMNGYFNVDKINLTSEHGSFSTDSIQVLLRPEEEQPSMHLVSELVNADLWGHYNLKDIPGFINAEMRKHMQHMSQLLPVPTGDIPNDFDFKMTIANLKPIADVLDFPIKANGYTHISGKVNSIEGTYDAYVDVPYLLTERQLFDSIVWVLNNDTSKLESVINIDDVKIAGKHGLENFELNYVMADDTLSLLTKWSNDKEMGEYSGDFSASLTMLPFGNELLFVADVLPSHFVLADTLWNLNQHEISMLNNRIIVDSLMLYKSDSHFSVDGVVSDKMSDTLAVNVSNFDLNSVARFLNVKNLTFGGYFSGDVEFYSILNSPVFVSDLVIEEMHLNNSQWGTLAVNSVWDPEDSKVNLHLSAVDSVRDTSMMLYGDYYPKVDSLDMIGQFEDFEMGCINPYLETTLKDLFISASGQVDVKGSIKSPELYGALMAANSTFLIEYIGVDFMINDSIYFDDNKFVFKDTKVYDAEGNVGLVNGAIAHTGYKHMMVDLLLESDRFIGLNTTAIQNEYFYGNVYFGGAITIFSTHKDVTIGSRARTLEGSNITVPLSPVSTAEVNDFITFYSTKDVEEAEQDDELRIPEIVVDPIRSLVIDLNFELTPEANLALEFDAQRGDVIKARGLGNVNLKFQKGQPFQMFGEYNIVDGNYMLTLQSIINKPFRIDKGSVMRWSGAPGDAIVDITATYKTRASLYNLMPDAISESNKNRRVPVDIKLMLNEQLRQPDISFDIELPNTDEETQQSVSSIIGSQEEMSRQVLSLLIVNNFYTPDYYNAGTATTNNNQLSNAAAVTVSEFLSNQLSSWVSQISNNVDLGFRYMPEQELIGEGLTPEEYEMAISSQFFNDRLTVNGNVGYQNYENGDRPANLNSNFVGEIDVTLKCNENIDLKAYSHQNDDILYESSSMKQGFGISYAEDFSTVKELKERYKSRLKRFFTKNKDKEQEDDESEDPEDTPEVKEDSSNSLE